MHIKLNLPVHNHPLAAIAIHTTFIPGVLGFLRSSSSPDINSVAFMLQDIQHLALISGLRVRGIGANPSTSNTGSNFSDIRRREQ